MTNPSNHSHLWPGVPLAIGSAVLFGASTPLSKLLLGVVDPWLLAGLLYLGAGVGLGAVNFGRGMVGLNNHEAPLRRADAGWLAAIVVVGGVVGPLLLMLGLARTSAASASLLLNLEGVATMGIAWLVLRENVDRRLLLGAAAILAGAAVLSWQGGAGLDLAGLFVAGACLAWGVDNNLTRKLSSADPVQMAMLKGLVAGATNLVLAVLLGAKLPSSWVIVAGGFVGLFGIGISLVMFMLGLRHLGAARTSAYFSFAPFVGAVLSVILFRDAPGPQLVLAGSLMALGLWLHLAERHEHSHLHDAIEHEHAHTHDEHHRHAHDGAVVEPHSHWHRHAPLRHSHPHYPDIHHRHRHG